MTIIERFKPYAAAYLVLVQSDTVLLLRRFNTGYQDGKYSLVAGHLDGGETAVQCIIREAKEEVGIVVRPQDIEVVHVMHRLNPYREYFDVYLRTSKWTGDVANVEPDKCSELRWSNKNELPNDTLPEVKHALECISENVHYSEFGW
jgi:8-oxo-dGTP pyrophosphatase MutT (NUDIX family)